MKFTHSNFLMTAGLLARELGIKVPIRILVLDDDVCYFPIIKMLLDKSGSSYDIKFVTTCDEAELAIKSGQYDLYVIDIGLSSCTGIEFVESMRNKYGAFPFVFLTGNDMSDRIGMSQDCLSWIHKLDTVTSEAMDRNLRYAIKSWHLRDIKCNQDCDHCILKTIKS